MKKIISILIALALTLSILAFAEEFTPAPEMSGFITEIVEDGFLMKDMHVIVTDDTVMDTDSMLNVGDFVTVSYSAENDGSVTADVVVCHMLNGTVTDASGLNESEPYFLMLPEGQTDAVQVYTDALNIEMVAEGASLTVYFNGMMSRSIPAQITAQHIRGLTLHGTVSEIDEDGSILLTMQNGDSTEDAIIHVNDDTLLFAEYAVGDEIRAVVGGTMTMSIPAQYNALELLPGAFYAHK